MSITAFAEGAIELSLGPIARLTFNAPQRCNAFSRAMWEGLAHACESIGAAGEVRVIVISGAGQHFSAGADISEFQDVYATPESTAAYNGLVRSGQPRLRNVSQPVIAEVRGACLGAGCSLAMSADFRFASTTARLGVTVSRLGLAYSPEDTAQLIEKVGSARTKDMLLSGRLIEAQEAVSWGLVDRVLPDHALGAAVTAYATELAARSRTSLAAVKRIVNALSTPSPELCDELRHVYLAAYQSPDSVEGRAAFLERRTPRFP